MNGIGAYYSPSPLRPVGPSEATPVRSTSGLGSYYSPSPLRPVGPPEAAPLTQTAGLGEMSEGTRSALGLLFVLALGFWLLRTGGK